MPEFSKEEGNKIKDAWREAHPNVVRLWHLVENAAKEAIRAPGSVVTAGRVAFRVFGGFLCLRLASGRVLYYYRPALAEKELPWSTPENVQTTMGITFEGMDNVLGSPTYGKWARIDTYGGRLVENIVQATSRDVCMQGALNAEKAGYPVVLTVHDEIVSEVPLGFGDVEEFEKLVCNMPYEWADGLPLKAEGWRGLRYRK